MTKSPMQRSLDLMITVRERELERRVAELARKQALGARYLGNVQRLEQLAQQLGSCNGTVLDAGLAANRAAYQQGVRALTEAHRQELALHEADTAHTRHGVQQLARRQHALGQVLDRSLAQSQAEQQRREQKSQDAMAGQAWLRGQA